MVRPVKLLNCLVLLSFLSCGVKAPPTPYVDVVAKEKAKEEAMLKNETPTPEPTPTKTAEPVKVKKTDSKKKK